MNLRMWVRIHVSQPSSPVSLELRCKMRRNARNSRAFCIPFGTRDWVDFEFLPPGFRILSHGHFRSSESCSRHAAVRRSSALDAQSSCKKSGEMRRSGPNCSPNRLNYRKFSVSPLMFENAISRTRRLEFGSRILVKRLVIQSVVVAHFRGCGAVAALERAIEIG